MPGYQPRRQMSPPAGSMQRPSDGHLLPLFEDAVPSPRGPYAEDSPEEDDSAAKHIRIRTPPRLHPDAYKMRIGDGGGTLNAPPPPEGMVFHAELLRHGGDYIPSSKTEDAVYQNAVSPPVPRRTPPPAILIDPALVQAIETGGTSRSQAQNSLSEFKRPATPSANIRTLAPPVANLPMNSPLVASNDPTQLRPQTTANLIAGSNDAVQDTFYDVTKPTCSLNIICYRSGASGCELQQVQCTLRSRFPDDESFEKVLADNKHLVCSDAQLFEQMQRLYQSKMCSGARRYLSLKSLRAFRILAVSKTHRFPFYL